MTVSLLLITTKIFLKFFPFQTENPTIQLMNDKFPEFIKLVKVNLNSNTKYNALFLLYLRLPNTDFNQLISLVNKGADRNTITQKILSFQGTYKPFYNEVSIFYNLSNLEPQQANEFLGKYGSTFIPYSPGDGIPLKEQTFKALPYLRISFDFKDFTKGLMYFRHAVGYTTTTDGQINVNRGITINGIFLALLLVPIYFILKLWRKK